MNKGNSFNISEIKKAIRDLTEEKRQIDKKISAFQGLLDAFKVDNGVSKQSARGGVDIRPFIKAIFQRNSNQPLQLKDIGEEVGKLAPEVSAEVIRKKLVYAIRPSVGLLEKAEYGKYRLANATDTS
jgi:hypothetical protein